MKAYVRHKYGGPEVLQMEEVAIPKVADKEVLIRAGAITVNPVEWHRLRARPLFMRLMVGFFKPKNKIIGADISGVVEEIGNAVRKFKVGDEVFGDGGLGSFGELNAVNEEELALKPSEISHEEAAALGVAGLTALQGVRDHAKVKKGERVLVNGASGGVGHYTVQLAKVYGAEVTAVCSTKNIEMVKQIGADNVIDYTKENIHKHQSQYDVLMDIHGNLSFSDYKRMCHSKGRGIMIGYTGMGLMMKTLFLKTFSRLKIIQFTAKSSGKDSRDLGLLHAEGKIKTVFDRAFTFEQIPEAITYIEHMHTSGKVSISYNT